MHECPTGGESREDSLEDSCSSSRKPAREFVNSLGQAGKELFTRGCCRIYGVVETPGLCPEERFQGGVLLPLGPAPGPWAELVSLDFTQGCEFHLQYLRMEASLVQ